MCITKKDLLISVFLLLVCGLFLCSCKRSETEIFMEHVEQSSEKKEQMEEQKEDEQESEHQEEVSVKIKFIWVDISGAVNMPGVYRLEENARLFEAIEAAGGFTEEAEPQWLNQASVLQDGEKIRVYTKEEVETMKQSGKTAENLETEFQNTDNQMMEQTGKINLNTATLEILQRIPGIGEVRARDIMNYREKNGTFKTVEDVQKVPGIKGKTYEKIADYICVN